MGHSHADNIVCIIQNWRSTQSWHERSIHGKLLIVPSQVLDIRNDAFTRISIREIVVTHYLNRIRNMQPAELTKRYMERSLLICFQNYQVMHRIVGCQPRNFELLSKTGFAENCRCAANNVVRRRNQSVIGNKETTPGT